MEYEDTEDVFEYPETDEAKLQVVYDFLRNLPGGYGYYIELVDTVLTNLRNNK